MELPEVTEVQPEVVVEPVLEEPVLEEPVLEEPVLEEPVAPRESVLAGRRATVVLVVLAVVLALAAGGLLGYRALDEDAAPAASRAPVVLSSDDATAGVAAAAEAAETIVGTSWQDYDEQVDEATALMTEGFAKEYRQTAADIEPSFVDAKTEIQARVVGQGVVSATRTEVKALVFLNQYTSKDGGDTTYTPFRALVTVVHTEAGWLVSALDTK